MPATIVTSAALVLLAVLVIALGRRLPRREPLEGALLLTLIPLLSPQGWDYVAVLTTIVMIHVVNDVDRLPLPLRAAQWVPPQAACAGAREPPLQAALL